MQKVLFVCLGNICRSPIAEAVFAHLIKERGLESQWSCDSAALGGWHEGNPPDHRARKVLSKHKIPYTGVARVIFPEDYSEFDYILGMDENNISGLKRNAPDAYTAKIMLLGDFDPKGERIIRDPYYDDGIEGFEKCYEQCVRSCAGFLDEYTKRP